MASGKRAYLGIRKDPHYRREAFATGLRACGYDVRFGPPQTYDEDTVYCSWNRCAEHHDYCNRLERAGGTCLIAENGYVQGRQDGGDYYALAIGGHNGSGTWPRGDSSRWDALGIDLKPWRTDGAHILVAPNRSFGAPGMMMPLEWPRSVVKRLRAVTKREIRVRPHPGNSKPRVPLERDLDGCHAVVVWASSVGVKALISGVPVFACSPSWICRHAAFSDQVLHLVNHVGDFLDDVARRHALHQLAHAQYNVEEIASGEPFRHLLTQELVAA